MRTRRLLVGLVSASTVFGALLFNTAALAAAPEAPSLVTVESITATTANLRGVLNPGGAGEGGTYEFLYRESKTECKGGSASKRGLSFGNEGEEVREGSYGIAVGSTEPPFVPGLTGLTPDTAYTVCLLARNLSKGEETIGPAVTFTTALPPETPVELKAEPVAETTATLHGVLNPGGARAKEPGSAEFVYRQSATECQRTNPKTGQKENEKTASTILAPGLLEKEPAEAPVTELLPGMKYTFCLLAKNEAGEEVLSAPETFTTPAVAPMIESESVSEVSATSATLDAQIDPGGAETTYHFEYIDQAGYEKALAGDAEEKVNPYTKGASTPGSLLNGSDDTGHPASAHVQGLTPATGYEFRVVVSNSLQADVEGEPVSFTTQTASTTFGLPDGRAYEMVSPPQKNGARISRGIYGIIEAAAGGGAITYVSKVPTETGPAGFDNNSQDLSERGASGWVTRDLSLPHELPTSAAVSPGPEYRFFSSDLSSAIVQPFSFFTSCTSPGGAPQPCLSPEASEQTAFLQNTETGAFTPFVTGCPASGTCPPVVAAHANVPPGTVFGGFQEGSNGNECEAGDYCGPFFVAGTPDLSHVLLESDVGLTAGAGAEGGLYEASEGKLKFVGKGENEAGTLSPSNQGAFAGHGAHGISASGSRVIFRGKGENAKHEPVNVVLMRDTETGHEETVRLGEGEFQDASADDSRVFFDAGWNGELEVFEVTSSPGAPLAGKTTDLTEGHGMQGLVLGASEDGTYVYFISEGILTASGATATGDNLYVEHYNGTTWKATYITTLSSEDTNDWAGLEGGGVPEWQQALLQRQPTRVSPDGQWLSFMSQASLTGYDNLDAKTGRPDAEVYLYHAQAGGPTSLTCASCDPTGARPIGIEYRKISSGSDEAEAGTFRAWPATTSVAASLPGSYFDREEALALSYQPRYLSDSGRLFFNSDDALVPLDTNGTEDVYEYEPAKVGNCEASTSSGSQVYVAQEHGCVGLVSSGSSSEESAFLDASEGEGEGEHGQEGKEAGSDVFFLTSAKLAPQDQDTAYDVYDAHECTGASPCISPATAPPPCETEASCKASPEPQPSVYGLPSSATFNGPGNLVPPSMPAAKKVTKKTVKCKKPKKLSHGKCVKPKKKAKARKSAKRAGRNGRAK